MDKSTQKKRQAQKLAQSGAHAEAAEIYAKLSENGQLEPYDLVVFGDLLLRAGDKEQGVDRYVEALDSYAASGLNRNAIALAKKVQRLAPEHHLAHRKLGELYAAEGLSSESCLHYLEYLETLNQGGDLDEDEVENVCLRLLELSLPSFKVVDRVLQLAEQAGRAQTLAEGVMSQAERARTLGNTEAQQELTQKALALDPNVQTLAPRAGAETPAPAPEMFLDPGAVQLDAPAAPPEAISMDEPLLDPGDISFSDEAAPSEPAEVEAPAQEFAIEEVGSLEDAMAAFTDEPDEAGPEPDSSEDLIAPMGVPSPSLEMEIDQGLQADLEALKESPSSDSVSIPLGEELPLSAEPVESEAEALQFETLPDADAMAKETPTGMASVTGDDPDAIRARGLELMQNGEPHRAQREFMKAAKMYFDHARSADAAELYTRVIDMDPNHLDALRGMVEITHINGEKAKMAHWGCELGDVLLAREHYPEAKYQFERVLAFDPDNAKALSRVKRLNTMAGVQESGYGELTPTASEVEGAQVTVRDDESKGNGQSVFDLGEILDEFRASVVQHIPAEDTQSHYDLGMTYMEMGLHEEAIQEFTLAAESESTRLSSLEMTAECYRLLERYEEAVAVLEQIAGEGDAGVQARAALNLGRCVEMMGEWDQAEGHYYRALELDEGLTDAVEAIESLERRREQGAA